jgi:Na+/citrate or Na+/malate symporter
LFTDKRGFLLSDACASVLIVSVCALIVSAVMNVHTDTYEELRQKEERMEEKMQIEMEGDLKCQGCEVDLP